MPQVVGLITVKLAGLYHVDVRNGRYDAKRNVQQHVTTGGVKQSVGIVLVNGSFDEVIPKTKGLDWRTLKDFSMEWIDPETKTIIFQASGCNWDGISGSSDLGQATSSKNVTWKGTTTAQF